MVKRRTHSKKTRLKNIGTVYVSDTLRELSKKMKEFFDEYSINVESPSHSHPNKNAYKVRVGPPKKSGYEEIFK
jgi:hypothetical protein